MQIVTGTFASADAARAAVERLCGAAPDARVVLLMPDTPPRTIEAKVPTEPGEAPGMGAAVGGVVGGSLGLATASLVLPGVGPVVVAGMLAAGIAGAAGGGAAGSALEERLTAGVPRERLLQHEAALRRGASVALALAETDAAAERARTVFAEAGGALQS